MVLPLTGTVSVTNGLDTFTWTGTPLSPLNCVVGAAIAIAGRSYFIKGRTNTSTGLLTRVFAESTEASLVAEIEQLSPEQVQTATLNKRASDVYSQLSALDANGRGLFYNLIAPTGDNDPGPGRCAFNHASLSSVTEIYLDILDANEGGRDVTSFFGMWTPGTVVICRSIATTAYGMFRLSGSPIIGADYVKLLVDYIGNDGELSSEPLSIEWSIVGSGIQIDYVGTFAGRDTYDEAETGKFYASVDGADGAGPPTVLYRKEAGSGVWSAAIPFQGPESEPHVAVAIWDPGRPGAAEIVWQCVFDVPVEFPTDFASVNATSRSRADTAATAAAVYSICKNGVEFGTLTFAPAATIGVFDSAATAFAAGDRLTIIAPDPRDDTLAQIAITLAGTR